jgi:hypothetical protein
MRASRADVGEIITDGAAWMPGSRNCSWASGSALRDASLGERPMREIVDGQLARPSSHG